jgi:hypothetical protein
MAKRRAKRSTDGREPPGEMKWKRPHEISVPGRYIVWDCDPAPADKICLRTCSSRTCSFSRRRGAIALPDRRDSVALCDTLDSTFRLLGPKPSWELTVMNVPTIEMSKSKARDVAAEYRSSVERARKRRPAAEAMTAAEGPSSAPASRDREPVRCFGGLGFDRPRARRSSPASASRREIAGEKTIFTTKARRTPRWPRAKRESRSRDFTSARRGDAESVQQAFRQVVGPLLGAVANALGPSAEAVNALGQADAPPAPAPRKQLDAIAAERVKEAKD